MELAEIMDIYINNIGKFNWIKKMSTDLHQFQYVWELTVLIWVTENKYIY